MPLAPLDSCVSMFNFDFCHLLINFANNLDPDHARQNVRPDLDSNCLPFKILVSLIEFFEKVDFEKYQQ